MRAHIQQEITRIRNAVVAPRPTDQGLQDVVFSDFGSLLEALKLDGYQHLETELSFPVVVRQPDGTEIGANLILRPEAQSRAGVVVSLVGPEKMHTQEGYTFPVEGDVIAGIIPRTVHLENQRNPENLITVGSITWDIETAGEQGRQFLEALNTPGASVTLTVPRGFLDTPRDLGLKMVSLVTYNWVSPHPPYFSPEDMARTAMDWVKNQPGSNRDLLRIIAEEIYQGYRGQENGQDNAIQAVRNFLVSVAGIEDFDDSTERDPVTQRSRVLDAVYHSLIEVARTDPRLLVAWLEQISGVDATNQQGQHVGRAVRTEQGEVVEGGYNLQAGIDTIAALAELTNYPEVLDVLKDQLSGLLKANRALEDERYLVLSHKALGKLLPELDLEGVNLFHPNLSGANLSGANLNGANLRAADLTNANLTNANLFGAHLNGANLFGANLSNSNFVKVNLSGANLSGANLSNANLSGANLSGANLSGANLSGANLNGANLNGANLAGAHLFGAHLFGANLSNANLSNANLGSAFLDRANLIGANLSGVNLRFTDLAGADLTVADLTGANLEKANLTRANLSGAADLTGADLHGVNLIYANLSGANLTRTKFSEANLSGANLSGANLTGAIMTRQTLEKIKSLISEHGYKVSGLETVIVIEPNAQLNGSDLSRAYLYQANLQNANLQNANLQWTNLIDADLRGADLRGADLTGADLTGADFRGAILSPEQTQYISSRGGILDQAQPPTTDPDDPQIPAQTTPQSESPNEPNGGVVIGGNTIPTPEENLQLLRDLGIDPTGIRPDLLDDPTLKNLLREFRHTGDKEKARAKIAEWLKLKGVDLTSLDLPPHTGHEDKPNLEMPNTKFPGPKPNDREIPASQIPPPQADPPLTQALSNLKNSDDPARLMREWSEAGDPQLKALLTFEGLQQVLAYGLGGELLKGLSQYNLSRFLSAYNTENVLLIRQYLT